MAAWLTQNSVYLTFQDYLSFLLGHVSILCEVDPDFMFLTLICNWNISSTPQ